MQIREGKYYITREGRTVGPATPINDSRYHWNIPINGMFLAYHDDGTFCIDNRAWDIVADARAIWLDMTPEQKGALLLAYHEGKVVEHWDGVCWVECAPTWFDDTAYRIEGNVVKYWDGVCWLECGVPYWNDDLAYRIRPEPKREVVERWIVYSCLEWVEAWPNSGTHRITFTTIDGKPDCASIKMEEV